MTELLRIGPPRPSRARAWGLGPGRERHEVPGGGARLLALAAGDRVTVTDVEGAQAAEVAVWPDPAVLGLRATGPALALRGVLLDPGAEPLRRGLLRRGLDAGAARAARLPGGAPGASESFVASAPCTVAVTAPGGAMSPDASDTATPLLVVIERAARADALSHDLPEPLADPLLDLRVASATAEAFAVRAGDWIQVIDVDGRQCTDFQAFSARKLDRGRQLPIDVTTSRTLMGHDFSRPGLHSKYYDVEMEPLVEVVQDTVGRHDAFALACSAKYYDDIGYPGHANCSENFNRALAPHGVDARPGWMAVNLFFNTAIDATGAVVSDEPWSRPGDFVLFRALTDLVCVNSACPDDTTPANGWRLTDIHVRTYSGAERFSRAVATRALPDSEPRMTKDAPFAPRTAALTGHVAEYRGFWLPQAYSSEGPLSEYWACREKVVVMDLSPLRKVEVTGPDAEALCDWVLTRDVSKLSEGGVVYSALCHPHGGMIDDGTLFRLGRDNLRWVCGDDLSAVHIREECARLGLNALVRTSTDQLCNLAVQGPLSRDLLKEIVWTAPHRTALADLTWFRFVPARLGGPTGAPLVVSRTGYTGELGYEVFCHPKDALALWDAVWEAGQPLGLKPMGLLALDTVRIEAGLVFAGAEFDSTTDPFEAGIGFTVPLKTKARDFLGREALIRRKEHPSRRFVGLHVEGEEAVGHGDPLFAGRAQVGVVTSATRSPILGRQVALARVDVAHAELGTSLEVGRLDGRQKRIGATVTPPVHYDPKKLRPQA